MTFDVSSLLDKYLEFILANKNLSKNTYIGYKNDLDMVELLSNSGLLHLETVEMPANNLAFVLRKDS